MFLLKKIKGKYLTAVFVLCIISLMFVLSAIPFAKAISAGLQLAPEGTFFSVKEAEKSFNHNFAFRNQLMNLNGRIEKTIGKRQIKDWYAQDNGGIVYVVEKYDTTQMSNAIVEFNNQLKKELGKEISYIQFPFQIDEFDKQLPKGIEDYSNENTNELLQRLRKNNIDVLDLRIPLHQEKTDYYSCFFKTDHHWKPETAFWAFQKIQEYFKNEDPSFCVDSKLTNFDNYSARVFDNFIGSEGRSTSPSFCGYERFLAISPKFNTNLTVFDSEDAILSQGNASETLLHDKFLKYKSWDYCDEYDYYLGMVDRFCRIQNNNFDNKNSGININGKKIFIIKDSFAHPMIPFFAYGYRETTFADLRSFQGNLMDEIREANPDKIFVMYNPGAYCSGNNSLFEFLK